MKRIARIVLSGAFFLAGLTLGSAVAEEDAAARGLEIAQERKARDTGWDATEAAVEMTLYSRGGSETVRQLRIRSLEVPDSGSKSLIIFDLPSDVRGTVVLTHSHIERPDDQWIFLPSIRRVKRVSSSNQSGAFMGSEFAFEDLSSFEVEKYDYEYLGEDELDGMAMYKVASTPLYSHSGYTRLITWIDQEHYRPWKTEFYDRRGELLKTLTASGFSLYEDRFWRASVSYMENHQTGRSTKLEFKEYDFNVSYREADFRHNVLNRVN
ncbi:outer membrane lipoprotein-sorting protein [Alkalilimnicola ehrlichii]|uniref:Outer membrane lipoprotein-sorting protein n=1 Tax=Alkalilimnicola ehrlichii TaxID=351052 RepID=A0A3E0WZL7_9GAMM|nr:outer membrane lipoprotein-sorting protein [Alkalilimnicola ehrlichii]RFA28397.1 outer membrane lipoprotein-sorting protein [Alkalilimnicola ehrlichii]RFA38539.1 outer membrane lipoprotein-sorting protein [Alkalilimnicola ehrlichii]